MEGDVGEGTDSVDCDPVRIRSRGMWNGNVDRQSLLSRQDPAALAGGAEAQSRAGAAREDPRQPSPFRRDPAVTDGEDASMQ